MLLNLESFTFHPLAHIRKRLALLWLCVLAAERWNPSRLLFFSLFLTFPYLNCWKKTNDVGLYLRLRFCLFSGFWSILVTQSVLVQKGWRIPIVFLPCTILESSKDVQNDGNMFWFLFRNKMCSFLQEPNIQKSRA